MGRLTAAKPVLRVVLRVGIAVTVLAGIVIAQSPLAQIKVTEQEARTFLDQMIARGGPTGLTDFPEEPLQVWRKLPAATKGPLTTQLYAWAKTYTSSPAFKAQYQKNRAAAKPVELVYTETVDQELKTKIGTETASIEDTLKYMEANGMKAQAAEQRKEFADRLKTELTPAWRLEIEQRRQQEKDGYISGVKAWEARCPPDPNTVIARQLREFLAATPDVDFAAKQGPVLNGTEYGFLNSAYWRKPWQWKYAWEWGPEAIAAARTAAAAWLAELGK